MGKGPLIIVSGPSGIGKSTVIRRLLTVPGPPLRLSVSATTRARRDGEVDGVHYHFWTPERFEEELGRDGFLEWAQVYGNYYGTLRAEVEPHRERGTGVLLDIDVQGAEQVRRRCPDALSIFLEPLSMAVLEERLRGRGTENEASIQRRLQAAEGEMARAGEFDHRITNDVLDRTVADVAALVGAAFQRGNHAG
jgi:guanylate kinase